MQTWLRWIEETLLVLGPADPSPLWTRATLWTLFAHASLVVHAPLPVRAPPQRRTPACASALTAISPLLINRRPPPSLGFRFLQKYLEIQQAESPLPQQGSARVSRSTSAGIILGGEDGDHEAGLQTWYIRPRRPHMVNHLCTPSFLLNVDFLFSFGSFSVGQVIPFSFVSSTSPSIFFLPEIKEIFYFTFN
jgi:hypothetical protein